MDVKSINAYIWTALWLIGSSLGYVVDLFWEFFLNNIYIPLGIDPNTGNTTWFCFVSFLFLRFKYLPQYAPLVISDSLWYPELSGNYDFCKDDDNNVYLIQNNVYYKTDLETIKFLGELDIEGRELPIVNLTKLQKAWSMFYVNVRNFNCYILNEDNPRFFYKNGITLIEINDVYSYYYLLEVHGFDNCFEFEELDSDHFHLWSEGMSFQDSMQIHSEFGNLNSLEFDYLQRTFEEEGVENWLQGRFFRDIHSFGKIDNEIKIRTDQDSARFAELNRLANIYGEIVALDHYSFSIFTLQYASDNLLQICQENDKIIEVLKEAYDSDRRSLGYNLLYESKLNSAIGDIDFDELLTLVNDQLDLNEHSASIRNILTGIRESITRIQIIEGEEIPIYNSRGTIIIGDAFMGKTHLIANLVNERFKQNLLSVLYRTGVSFDPNWFEVINRAMNANVEDRETLFKAIRFASCKVDMCRELIDQDFRFIRSRSQFLIASDAIDEAVRVAQWNDLIRNAESKLLDCPYLHFIYTSRPTFLDTYPEIKALNQHEIIWLNSSEVDLNAIYDLYKNKFPIAGIESQDWLRRFLTNALQIRLFFVAFADKDQINFSELDVSLESILNNYIQNIEDKIVEKDKTEKLSQLDQGYLGKVLTKCGDLLVESGEKWVRFDDLIEALEREGFNISVDSFNHLLHQLKNYDLIFEDIAGGDRFLRFHENSIIEYALAKSAAEMYDQIPTDIPDYLRDSSGALEMFGQLILKTKNQLIFKDFWQDQSSDIVRRKVLLGTLKGIPQGEIDPDYINWIYNEYGS